MRWFSNILRWLGSFLPNAVQPWIDGYARAPEDFLAGLVILGALVWLGSRLQQAVTDKMDGIWQAAVSANLPDPGPPRDLVYRLRTSRGYRNLHQLSKKHLAPAFFALATVYLVWACVNRFAFTVLDSAGFVCKASTTRLAGLREGEIVLAGGRTARLADLQAAAANNPNLSAADKANPFIYVKNLPVFEPANVCQSMRVKLDYNAKYLIRFQDTSSFRDGDIDASKGFDSLEAPSLLGKAAMLIGLPIRREPLQPWFTVVARTGAIGSEETFLLHDPRETTYSINETVTTTKEGELFLFVNDAVLGLPPWYGYFYGNNRGSSRVLILGK